MLYGKCSLVFWKKLLWILFWVGTGRGKISPDVLCVTAWSLQRVSVWRMVEVGLSMRSCRTCALSAQIKSGFYGAVKCGINKVQSVHPNPGIALFLGEIIWHERGFMYIIFIYFPKTGWIHLDCFLGIIDSARSWTASERYFTGWFCWTWKNPMPCHPNI